MPNKNYPKEILTIIRSNPAPAELKEKLSDYHENDLADALTVLTPEERQKLYPILGIEYVAEIFSYFDDAEPYLKELPSKEAAKVISNMDSDDAVDALDDLEEEDKRKIVSHLDEDSAEDVKMLLSYDEDEIGSRMTTNCIIIREDLNVKQAMSSLIDQAAKNDNISTIFVVNAQQKFYGAIDLKNLIIARRDETLEDLTVTSYPYVYAEEPINECIEELKDYSEDSIPVLDNDNRLLGVITSSNIIDLVDDEMGEDYAMFAGLTAEEDLKEPLKDSMKKRLPWLIILLGLGMLVSSVVGIFEQVVTTLPIIMTFQSLILDMAGNVGTQSLAVTIRVLMDESLTGKQKLQLVFKEMRIGFCNGLLLGVLSFAVIGLFIFLFKGKTMMFAFSVSACIGIALLLAMLISSAVGTCIPLFFKKIHIDPAVASGPLITTVNDLVAVVTFYGLSWLFLIEMLHLAG